MSREIHGRLMEALAARGTWEQRQRIWYEMLHDGLQRRNKPFPGAANLHEAIADAVVGKTQPYYVNSVFSRQQIAAFTPLLQETATASADAAQCLDWKLRKESNFPREFAHMAYYMLGFGRGILKTRWDAQARSGKGRLAFEAIDPLFFLCDEEQDDPDDMDVFCHIKQLSVAKYRMSKVYAQDADLIGILRGGENQAAQWKDQEKEMREGITGSANKELIILWETYERVEEGWKVCTFGPCAPDRPVRQDFIYPLKWQGEPLQPFVAAQIEITEKGWYAPRGLTEKVAALEAYATKMRNQKADWLEYCNKPLFTRDAQSVLGNTASIGLRPGDVLPPGLAPATMPPPPFTMDEEINAARLQAEELAQVPDFGATTDGDKKEARTATEMQYIGSFASQGIQYKAWLNGLFEGKIYKLAWANLVMFGGKELTYFAEKSRKVLAPQALHDNYLIEPDATIDAVNRTQRLQRSVARYQMFKGHPNVNQEELVKSVLNDDDPRLVKTLFMSSGTKAANESEDEAIEISALLLEGYPAQANVGEDHVTRLRILFGKMQQLSQMGMPSTREEISRLLMGRQRMQEHIGQHLQLLQQENPAMAKQFMAAIQAVEPQGQGQPMDQGSTESRPTTETLSLSPGVGPGSQGPAVGMQGRMGAGLPAEGRQPGVSAMAV